MILNRQLNILYIFDNCVLTMCVFGMLYCCVLSISFFFLGCISINVRNSPLLIKSVYVYKRILIDIWKCHTICNVVERYISVEKWEIDNWKVEIITFVIELKCRIFSVRISSNTTNIKLNSFVRYFFYLYVFRRSCIDFAFNNLSTKTSWQL